MEDGRKSGLNLVFDTNVFLNDNGLEVFKSIRNDQIGTLPEPVWLFVPHVVRRELQNLSKGKTKKAQKAKAAYEFLNSLNNDISVVFQTKREAQILERTFYPASSGPFGSINDGLILIYSLSLDDLYVDQADTWLITNDNQLIARSVRSGLMSMSLTALKKAMQLEAYSNEDPDEEAYYTSVSATPDYLEHAEVMPEKTFRNASCQTTKVQISRAPENKRSVGVQTDTSTSPVQHRVSAQMRVLPVVTPTPRPRPTVPHNVTLPAGLSSVTSNRVTEREAIAADVATARNGLMSNTTGHLPRAAPLYHERPKKQIRHDRPNTITRFCRLLFCCCRVEATI